MIALRATLKRKLLRAIRTLRRQGNGLRPRSNRLFLYWSLRKAGESDLESTLRVSELEGPRQKAHSVAVFCVANGIGLSSDSDARRTPQALKSYESFEPIIQAEGGMRERLNLVESENRKALRVEADSLQTRLIVLTFILFIVPFAALLMTSYLLPEDASLTAIFLTIHPLVSYIVANWAMMRDDILAV